MRLAHIHIENYRCLQNQELSFEDLTVLIGANGTGKSSVLRAVKWFFEGGNLELEDVCGQQSDTAVSVCVTFDDLTEADREALGSFVAEGTATFWRIWSPEGSEIEGQVLAYPPFQDVRQHSKAAQFKPAYEQLRSADQSLDLPPYKSMDASRQAMEQWESDNSEKLEPTVRSAQHLANNSGQPKFAGRFDYVFVPAIYDAEIQTQDTRGTLLQQLLSQQLLSRLTENGERTAKQLQELRERMVEEADNIVRSEHGAGLNEIASRITTALDTYVPGARVLLDVRSPDFRPSDPRFGMRVTDGSIETDVGHQGHGFQRALLMATVQELAGVGRDLREDIDPPALFLAIEEPELHQHPTQARHLAKTLATLTRGGRGAVQVAYATHSEHFINPSRYERLRRFRKRASTVPYPVTKIDQATIERVVERLDNIETPKQVAKRIAITLHRKLSEAVLAHAVVLVEGRSDEGFLTGVAEREIGFDALGISVVHTYGKQQLHIPWAVLSELGIPTFVMFDGDGHREQQDSANWNCKLLKLLGDVEEDWPDTRIRSNYAVFENCLETELREEWPDMLEKAHLLVEETDDWRDKPEDCYYQAALEVEAMPPPSIVKILDSVKALL